MLVPTYKKFEKKPVQDQLCIQENKASAES